MQHNLITFLSKSKAVSKILSCCAVLVFVFVLISTDYQASAAGVPIQVPTVPFELGPLIKSYDDLNDEQKKIADAIAGGYGTAYSGYAGYSYDGTWTDAALELSEQITKYGSGIYRTIRKYLGDTGTQLLINPVGIGITTLQNILGGAVAYASEWAGTFSDWWSQNIYDSSISGGGGGGHSFVVDGDVNMNQGFMNLLGPGLGLYEWQQTDASWINNDFAWVQPSLSGTTLSEYNAVVAGFDNPHLMIKSGPSAYYFSGLIADYDLPIYDLFINTSNHRVGFVDSNGNFINQTFSNIHVVYVYGSSMVTDNTRALVMTYQSYNANSFNSYADIASYYLNNLTNMIGQLTIQNYTNAWGYPFVSDIFSNRVYVGADWSSRQVLQNIDDLNFDDTYERTVIDNPAIPFAIDLAKLIRSLIDDLAGTRDAVDGVTIRDATIGATIDKVTGLTITDAQVQKIAVQVEYPESGIIIPDGIFGGSMSYIEYLWNFTKPLVLYTRDLLHTLLFNGNGIAWIVYGIISVGLIGGVIVKFLL